MNILVEVVCDSVADAVAAKRAGAGRIELGCAPELGGLTPSVGVMEAVRAAVDLPVVALVRPRPGGFHYDHDELRAMERDIRLLLESGADCVATGALTVDGTIDTDALRRFVDVAAGKPLVFHRAFDVCADLDSAFDILLEQGVARVLTSGGAATALEGATMLAELHRRGQGKTTILPAGGIRSANAATVAESVGCSELHLGPRRMVRDPTSARGAVDYEAHTVCDHAAVEAVVAALGIQRRLQS